MVKSIRPCWQHRDLEKKAVYGKPAKAKVTVLFLNFKLEPVLAPGMTRHFFYYSSA